MKHIDGAAICFTPAVTVATTGTTTQSFDTRGYNQANIRVMAGTIVTTGETLRTIAISEHSSVTSASSMTDIVAFATGTTTSTSVPNTMPVITVLGLGVVLEYQVDLRKRERFIGVEVTPGTNTCNVSILTVLSRAAESADTAAEKNVINLNNTDSSNVALVVAG